MVATQFAHSTQSPPTRDPASAAARTLDATSLAQRGYVLFYQGDMGYVLPAPTLASVVDRDHLQPLPVATPGWAGTVSVRGGALPVLNARTLFGRGREATVVLLLRVGSDRAGWGPLGLAVERLVGLRDVPRETLNRIALGHGLLGGAPIDDGIALALDPEYLGSLRRAAVVAGPNGQPRPAAVAWDSAATPGGNAPASGRRSDPQFAASLRPGDPVVVLDERPISSPKRRLALTVGAVRGIKAIEALRVGPPLVSALRGYFNWESRIVSVVDLGDTGLTTTRSIPRYMTLVAADGGQIGFALRVSNVSTIQRLTAIDSAPLADGFIGVNANTDLEGVTVIDPTALLASVTRPLAVEP